MLRRPKAPGWWSYFKFWLFCRSHNICSVHRTLKRRDHRMNWYYCPQCGQDARKSRNKVQLDALKKAESWQTS